MIEIFDNFFEEEIHKDIFSYCQKALYSYGEVDYPWTPPVGMISQITKSHSLFQLFEKRLSSLTKFLPHRMYVNCFSPNENPYFHKDDDYGETVLYYPNLDWHHDEHGETQFMLNNEIKGILPIPNRLIKFDATLLHRATCFRTKHRFTLAVKYR